MAFIQTVPVDEASGDVRAMYQRRQEMIGYVPNFAKVFSRGPQVFAAWEVLISGIRQNLDARRYELVTLAAARALKSSYCMLAHGTILRDQFYSEKHLAAIAQDYADSDLEPADVAMMAFAERVVFNASDIREAEVQELRTHGFTDDQIFGVAAAAAARCFLSKLVDALGAQPDSDYERLERDLKRVLTPGRTISKESVERVPGS